MKTTLPSTHWQMEKEDVVHTHTQWHTTQPSKRMELEVTILSEICQAPKDKYLCLCGGGGGRWLKIDLIAFKNIPEAA